MLNVWGIAGVVLAVLSIVLLRYAVADKKFMLGGIIFSVLSFVALVINYGVVAGIFTGFSAMMVVGIVVSLCVGKASTGNK